MAIFVSFSVMEIALMMLPKMCGSSQEHLQFSHGAFPCGLRDLGGCGTPHPGSRWSQANKEMWWKPCVEHWGSEALLIEARQTQGIA